MELTFILKNDSCPSVSKPSRPLRSASLIFGTEISSLAELIIMEKKFHFLFLNQWHELRILRNIKSYEIAFCHAELDCR